MRCIVVVVVVVAIFFQFSVVVCQLMLFFQIYCMVNKDSFHS